MVFGWVVMILLPTALLSYKDDPPDLFYQ